MDDFEEVRHLGRGAYGEVLLMRQTSTGLLCAVKKLGKAAMTAGEEAEHLAEVKALQALQHPCILRYYGSTELDESVSLVMEFADAGDLQHLLKAQADSGNLFEAAQLFALFSQLVIAVAHVHSNRVLHRDLKPSNVMLTSDGLLKLGDFGVAKVLAGTTVMDNMTCVGSPTYMAPEIVSGDPYGAACDVWSLGVILYEMASFQRPFEGRSLGELVMRISSGQFKDLREHIQEKPGGQFLEEAVRPFTATMLVPEPKHRGTMKEVVRLPTMQVFASSLKTSAIVVAALLRDLQEPAKSKGVEIDSAAVNDLIAELATSPKAAGTSAPSASGASGKGGQVRSSLQSKALKQTVQEDSLMLSMTNASDFDSSSSQRCPASGSKEISFQLTATSQLPVESLPTSQRTEEAAHRSAHRTAVLAASQDQHALRDVLGDALGGTEAPKRTASPGSIPVLNQSTSEVTKALAKRTAQRDRTGGTASLAASQDQHALRDVLGDALGPGLDSGRRPSRLSETEASTGTQGTRLQHSQSTGTVKEATALMEEVAGDGGIFMDQVSPAWKVSSSSSREGEHELFKRGPPFMATLIRMHRGAVSSAALRVRAQRCVTSAVGEFRRSAKVPGVTVISDDQTAEKALQVLQRLGDRVHGWDTETTEVHLGQRGQTPCHTGQVVCATAYCGDDVDFGDGPMLLIDNMGPAAGLIERKFRSYFEDASYKKVFHNYAFDKLMLKREGIAVDGLAADTLILARLHDTSLASWEGRERASKLMKDRSMAESFERSMTLEGKEPSRAVKGVAFAGKKIDLKSFSSASNLHTISIPMENATKIKQLPKMRMGYDLKSLAFQYGIAGSTEPSSFRQLFGASGNAAREKFDSPDHFTEFATYAAHDAVYTWKLFHFFQESLQKTAWNSAVQRRPIDKLLMDDAVAEELRDLRPQLFRMSRPKEKVKNRLPSSGGAAGTSASVQQDTGKTMWDFYSEYLSSRFSECLASMQERGILVDRARLKEIERKATEDLHRMESQYKDILGEIEVEGTVMNPDSGFINPRSQQQLRQLLFGGSKNIFDESEQLEVTRDFSVPKDAKAKDGSKLRSSERFTIESWGLEPAAGRKMFTKKGWPSTGKEALEKLQKDEAQNVQQQLEAKGWDPVMAKKAFEAMEIYRQMASVKKILTAFARPMQEHASEMNRIHPSWSYGTSTGRLSCSNPNLQGIPADGKDSYDVRGAFIAGEGKTFIMADYSQLELRILAHMSQCPSMKKHFLKGGDYHSEVAADMYPYIKEAILRGEVSTNDGPDVPSVKSMFPQERKAAKAVNFGIVYGAQAQSLAEDLNISEEAAVELMEAWFKNKKAVRRWLEDVKAQSSMEGRSRSLLGKHRHLPLLKDEDVPFWLQKRSERAAVNFVIQGSGADLVTAAMLQLESHPRLTDLGFHLVMQVHDEFVLEGPSEKAQEASEIVKTVMEKPFKETMPDFSMLVPLEVSISVSETLAGKA